jgi:hypothetical protein
MNKSLEIIFLTALILAVASAKMKTKTKWYSDCYRYGTLQAGITGGIQDTTNTKAGILNGNENKAVNIAYYQTKEECKEKCKTSPFYYGCQETGNEYDNVARLPKERYVCWLKESCSYSDDSLFVNKDASIRSEYEYSCDYTCRTTYGHKGGKCLQDDNVYVCYWRVVA